MRQIDFEHGGIAQNILKAALPMLVAQVLNLLRRLQKERGITYLFIAHDLSVMRYISDRIAVIHKGRIVELAEAEERKIPDYPAVIEKIIADIVTEA